jgi:hypothetical protein
MPRDLSRFVAPDLVDQHCTECGARVPDEFASCDQFFMATLTALGSRWGESPARAHEWAEDVWEAYSSQQGIARGWVEKAIGG